MRRANPYREAIRRILRDEQRHRPGCALVSTIGVDEDGRAYIHFTCLQHQAAWRYYIHAYIDTELATASYSGSELSSRCPVRDADGVPFGPSAAEALEESPEVADEVS